MNAIVPTTRVLYSCDGCGLTKIAVDVPARTDEDVGDWVHSTAVLLGADHDRRKPRCRSGKVDMMIPATGTDRVGGAPVQ